MEVRRSESSARLFTRLSRQAIDPEWAAELLLEEAQAAFLLEEAMAAMAADARAREEAQAAAREIAAMVSEVESAPSRPVDTAADDLPPLPSADVPTGFIWPAHTGRAVIRSLDLDRRGPLSFDEAGRLTLALDGRRLRTSRASRYPDGESARQALVRAARLSSQLERLLAPDTVLVAQSVGDAACWLWTIQPELRTLQEIVNQGTLTREQLASLGEAIVGLVRTGGRHGFEVDISLASFAVDRGMLRYVGELTPHIARDVEQPWAGVSDVLEDLGRQGVETGPLCDAIDRELARGPLAERSLAAFSRASQSG